MSGTIRLAVNADAAETLVHDLEDANLDVRSPTQRVRGVPETVDVVVALSSAGTLSLFYRALVTFLDRNRHHEVHFEHEGRKVIVKGHGPREELELLCRLTPKTVGDETTERTE